MLLCYFIVINPKEVTPIVYIAYDWHDEVTQIVYIAYDWHDEFTFIDII